MFDDFGLNVAGYLTAELGLGEVARNYVSVIQHLGVNTSLQDASFITHQRKSGGALTGFSTDNPHAANLVCINAPEIKHFIERFGPSYFRTKYNIGSWWWEVEELPQEWKNEFYRFDELWVGTHFIQQNLARVSPIPVHVVQPYVVPLVATPCRAEVGLAPEDYVFLFAFDYFSCFERKNPISTVRAFKLAFQENEQVKLLIKTTNGDKFKAKSESLAREAGDDPRIILMDKYCSKAELNNLIASCDAYVSLHRTEGFGLPIAEAMLLNKPVIATGWSGNLDFNTNENSLLVKHDFSVNQEDYGPYKKGMRWAEPDVEHAAKLMRTLFEDRSYAGILGERGAQTVRDLFGRDAVERVIAQRLESISAKVKRVAKIDQFKRGLLRLEAPTVSDAVIILNSDLQPAQSHTQSRIVQGQNIPLQNIQPQNTPPQNTHSQVAQFQPAQLETSRDEISLLETSQLETAADQPDGSTRIIQKVEAFFTKWWHNPKAGKPLRLVGKLVARYLASLMTGAEGSKFRRDMIETSFEGVAKLVKSDSDQIDKLEQRVKELEAQMAARANNKD